MTNKSMNDDTARVAEGLKKYKNEKVTILVKDNHVENKSSILEDDTARVAEGLKKYKNEKVTLLINDNTPTL